MRDLEPVRAAWLRDRPRFERFVECLKGRANRILKDGGIWGRVTGRAKEIDSLLKKLIRKPHAEYDAMPDKAGIRIVVRFAEDIEAVRPLIGAQFHVLKEENVTERLGTDRLGYQGVHFDIALRQEDPEASAYQGCIAELQVRTLAQDVWSEMSHELNYKAESCIAEELCRRVNCLSALMETADREFSAVNNAICAIPEAMAVRVQAILEKYYCRLCGLFYDKELSVNVIGFLWPLYQMTTGHFGARMDDFFLRQERKLRAIYAEQLCSPSRSVFLSQPEALMIFDLVDKDQFALRDTWAQYLPESELQRLAVAWGRSLQ